MYSCQTQYNDLTVAAASRQGSYNGGGLTVLPRCPAALTDRASGVQNQPALKAPPHIAWLALGAGCKGGGLHAVAAAEAPAAAPLPGPPLSRSKASPSLPASWPVLITSSDRQCSQSKKHLGSCALGQAPVSCGPHGWVGGLVCGWGPSMLGREGSTDWARELRYAVGAVVGQAGAALRQSNHRKPPRQV